MAGKHEELEEEFRYMIIQVARGLKRDDCETIVYLKVLPVDTCYPGPEKHDVKLFTLITLEARAFISPLNPDPLKELLEKVNRQDLTKFVDGYLSKRMNLMKKMEKERKKSKRQKKKGEKNEQQHQLGPNAEELFLMKAASSTKEQLKRLQTLTLSYISRLMQNAQALHAVIHNDDSSEGSQLQKEEACHAVVEETKKFDRKFRKVLSAARISSSKDSTSSEESGVGLTDERKDCDSSMPHRKHCAQQKIQYPSMEQGSRQPNSAAYTPVSGGVPVIPATIVGLPQPTKPFHHKPASGHMYIASDIKATAKASRTSGTSRKRPPPLPPPKPKPTYTHSPPVKPNSNPGSGDSGVYITHSLPSLLDDDHHDQHPDQGSYYENNSHAEENEYDPLEYDDDNAIGGSTNVYEPVEYVGSIKGVHLKPMKARASSMDDTLCN